MRSTTKTGVSIREVFFTSFDRWPLVKNFIESGQPLDCTERINIYNEYKINSIASVFTASSVLHKQSFPFGTLSPTTTATVVYTRSNNKVEPIISKQFTKKDARENVLCEKFFTV